MMSEEDVRDREEPTERDSQGEAGVGGAGSEPERLLLVKETLEGILERLGVDAKVEVKDTAESIACRIDVPADDPIFGESGAHQVLEALEFLANRMVSRDRDERKRIVLALDESVGDADQRLADAAKRLARASSRMKKALTVVGMDARHRKVVHQAIADEAGARSRSEGYGALRRIVVEGEEEE